MPVRAIACIALLAASRALAGGYGVADDLQPATYTSPSGAFALTVDPDTRHGGGPARYTLRRGRATVWTAHKPFTLWEAAVGNDGTVGGYGYSHGYNGALNVGRAGDDGSFFVAILDPHGAPRAFEETPRTSPRRLHTMADPRGAGVWIDAVDARLVVRTVSSDRDGESWWAYSLADGKPSARVTPSDGTHDDPAHIVDAKPVRGTPLILVDWLRGSATNDGKERLGARFALVDPQGHAVWSLDLPDDYTIRGDEKAQNRMLDGIWRRSAILAADKAARFDLWIAAKHARASFAVEGGQTNDSSWHVRHVAEVPSGGLAGKSANHVDLERLPLASLRKLGTIALAAPGTARDSPVRNTARFGIDDRGRFGFLASCSCSAAHDFQLVDRKGAPVRTITLPDVARPERHARLLAWIRGDRWVVVTSSDEGEPASAAWLDAGTGEFTPIAGFDAPQVKYVTGTRDGGFVAVTEFDEKSMGGYSPIEGVAAYDGRGRKLWSVTDRGEEPAKVFSPVAIAVTSRDEVVVLDNIENKLRVFTRQGRPIRSVDLEKAWGSKRPEVLYPTSIHSDLDGGVIVQDFEGHPPIVRMTTEGKVLGRLDPARPDGHRLALQDGAQCAPEGSLWASEGNALLRLDAKGIVAEMVGSAPDPDRLQEIVAIAVDAAHRIYAVDKDTGAVHVFAPDGHRLRVDHPAPTDYQGTLSGPSLTASADGEVYVSRHNAGDAPEFLHYAADGHRLGVASLKLDDTTQSAWLFQPGSTNRWVVGYPNVYLVDGHDRIVRKIERLADRHWIESPGPAAVAGDGSIAVLSGVGEKSLHENPDVAVTVGLYARDGAPIASWPAPIGPDDSIDGVAWDGAGVILQVRKGSYDGPMSLVSADPQGHPKWRLPLSQPVYQPVAFVVRQGATRELWLFDGDHSFNRYALE